MGRATQGVTLISLDDGEKLAGLEKVAESVAEVDAEAESDAEIANPTVNPENEQNPESSEPNEGGEA
jgi:DNA gyrase subunit A